MEDGARCPWGAGAADLFGGAIRLRRDARHPRAHRPLCAAGGLHGEPARPDQAGARAPVREKGDGACGRQLRRIEGAAAAADVAAASGQLRFRPRHVFPAHRRLGLRDGIGQDRRSARQRRAGLALFRVHAGPARCHRRAHPQRAGGRQARHCHRAPDRPTRRDLTARQRCDVHFRPRTRAVDLRLPHGRGRRHRVLRDPCAAGTGAGAHRLLSD